jgi:hypothetical protein
MLEVKLQDGNYECVAEKTDWGQVTMRSDNVVLNHLVMRKPGYLVYVPAEKISGISSSPDKPIKRR